MMITYYDVQHNEAVTTYIRRADESLAALGYTEHSFAHVGIVARVAAEILRSLGYTAREQELAMIAAHLHDIGNIVNRVDHAQSGAVMAFRILDNMGADPDDIATIISAIGNHDEGTAVAVNPIAAALILADKTDVRQSRVRNSDIASFDIHDRVNYSVKASQTCVDPEKHTITLSLTVDTEFCSLMDYFDIFLGRMLLCRRAAEKLGLKFRMIVNGQTLI